MKNDDIIVGIDLGTTYSEIAVFVDGQVRILKVDDAEKMPSCVGFLPDGDLLVGQPARNQQLAFPERTITSIKRAMGADTVITVGNQRFSPQEISAMILRRLVNAASERLGQPVTRAVITVPAYFSDAQRTATREAGAIAGLEVARILNEPTAASLAYGFADGKRQTLLVYDLGGGTFDVSIVVVEGDITEVLASHGNNHLGGDDFDNLLLDRLLDSFSDTHGIDLSQDHPQAYWRLRWAAEEAKRKLSAEPYVVIREEALVTRDGVPLHLEMELSRDEYEEMIHPLVESTLDSVSRALRYAGKTTRDLDAILLVGGSTRTPLVQQILKQRTNMEPMQDIHPDLCVALGAGVLASRLAGQAIDRVLVDVTPYSFGPSYLGMRDNRPYQHCYRPIIKRNTPLPVTRTERYFTAAPYQTEVKISIYQGDDPDAMKNTLVGEFGIKELTPMEEPNEVLCRMSLDIDGILHVSAIEKITGKSAAITISNCFKARSPDDIDASRRKVVELFAEVPDDAYIFSDDDLDQHQIPESPARDIDIGDRRTTESELDEPGDDGADNVVVLDPAWIQLAKDARRLLERSRALLPTMHEEDQEEAIELHEVMETAILSRETRRLKDVCEQLRELLFFVEGD